MCNGFYNREYFRGCDKNMYLGYETLREDQEVSLRSPELEGWVEISFQNCCFKIPRCYHFRDGTSHVQIHYLEAHSHIFDKNFSLLASRAMCKDGRVFTESCRSLSVSQPKGYLIKIQR